MKVSVIIPTYNEEKYIEESIRSVISCDFPKNEMEVLYVDGASSDRTREIIREYAYKYSYVKLLFNKRRITPCAENIGIKAAEGKYVIVAGAHSQFDNSYISKLVEAIELLDCEAVGGQLVTELKNRTKKSIAIKKVLSNKYGVGNAEYRIETNDETIREVDTAGFLCYNREFLIDIGMYNEKLIRNQDIELNKRIKLHGGKIFLIPQAKAIYFCREDYQSLAKNNFQNGKWNIFTICITRTFESLSLRHFIPLIFIFTLGIPMLLATIEKLFIFISIASFFAYNVLVFLQTFKMNDHETSAWLIIKAFYTIHFSYGIGSLIGILTVLFKKLLGRKY